MSTIAEETFQEGLEALREWIHFLEEQERFYRSQLERLRKKAQNQGHQIEEAGGELNDDAEDEWL